jgi:hypothetical protein
MSAGTYKRKIFKIAVAACAATVLSAGYAVDSTRHFFFVPASPSTSGHWAIAPRVRMSVAAISTTMHPRERRSPDEYPLCVDVGAAGRPVDYRVVVLARARY